MSNKEVIKAYFNGRKAHSPNQHYVGVYNLRTSDEHGLWTLMNYETALVVKLDDKYYVNTQKYSPTTSKIQHYIMDYLHEQLIDFEAL